MRRIGITGISGSLGTALVRAWAPHGVLVGTSRDELKAEKIMALHDNVRCMVVAAGLHDEAALRRVYEGCDIIVHAAALKRISGSVYATQEIMKANVVGTMTILRVARDIGVKKVIVVSSDKAVEATNLYGASKFCAECLGVQENAFSYPKGMSVVVVRYGNVLGSRGSVVHIWREQVDQGLPLTVTHGDMTRFIMPMDNAVGIINDAILSGVAGEILVPELPAAKMRDLATAIQKEAQCRNAGRNCWFTPTGLRPGGEKLHESLLSQEELCRTWRHQSGHWAIAPTHQTWCVPPTRDPVDLFDRPSYSSNLEPFLTVDELVQYLKDVPVQPAHG